MTTKTPTIYDAFYKIANRMQNIDQAYRNRSDFLILSELREGKPVYVVRAFKALGQDWLPGDEFTCNLSDLQRVSFILENSGRVLVTAQEKKDREEWARLKPVKEHLEPMVKHAQDFDALKFQAVGQIGHAQQALQHWQSELDAATANLTRTEREITEYLASLDLEI